MADTFVNRSLSSVCAEDLLVAWLLSLPDGLDPALAARPILLVLADQNGLERTDNRPRLLNLLEEVTRYPRSRLRAEQATRRRRTRSV